MLVRLWIYCLAASLALYATAARAEGVPARFMPALVYLSGDGDGISPFIQSAKSGINRAEMDLKTKVRIVPTAPKDDTEAIIKKLADSGASPIILLGGHNVAPMLKLAERYPNTRFTIIDGLVPPIYPNVQSILFKDNEGAFLVGFIAGKVTNSGHVGFIGGMDSPLIRNFAVGYEQGVKYALSDARITAQMIGTTAEAWSNPEKAHDMARAQYHENVDIVFAAAGGSNEGVLKAADEMGKLAIGVDVNQNALFPGRVLTSMVKRVDVAVYDILKNSKDGSWSAGIKYLGLKDGALDYAVDQNNRVLITEELIEEVATARDKIIDGKLVVESYSAK